MFTPSVENIPVLMAFASAFTAPTFTKIVTLACGALLTPGRRTVAAALRAVGLGHAAHFTNYHRVLNRAAWSALALSRQLFTLLVRTCVPPGEPLRLVVDDTLERRVGQHVAYKGLHRDPVRSTGARKVCSWGIRWLVVALLVRVPWTTRCWALPFLIVPLVAAHTCRQHNRRHWSHIAWMRHVVVRVYRWAQAVSPGRMLQWVGDGSYAAVELVRQCQHWTPQPGPNGLAHPVRLIARLRLDAQLHDPPAPRRPGQRGRPAKKGARQRRLRERVTHPQTRWKKVTVPWYGGTERRLAIATGTALWYTPGQDPVWIRWVLVRDLQAELAGKAASSRGAAPADRRAEAFFCSDPTLSVAELLAAVLGRWNIEVTFAELRAHLGFETQAQWTPAAVGRTTPCLCGLFSVVVLQAWAWHPTQLPVRNTAWYTKETATFSDVLAAVRARLWDGAPRDENYVKSASGDDWCQIPRAYLQQLQNLTLYAP